MRRDLTFLAALAAALFLLPSCERPRQNGGADLPKPTAPSPDKNAPAKNELPTLSGVLLDGFEGPEHTVWAFDSADDEGTAEYVTDGATQGTKALRVTLRGKGQRGKLHLRREVEWDLTQASALLADITSPADNLSAALALKTGGDMYQEGKPVSLKKGLNRDVRFALEGNTWKNAQSKWEFTGPPVNLQTVRRVMLLLFTNEESSGSFLVDNLQAEGSVPLEGGAAVYREWRPEILLADMPPEATAQYRLIEVPLVFRASYRDVFDSGDITVGMRVTTPGGRNLDVRGFFAGLEHYEGALPQAHDGAPVPPLFGPLGKKADKKGKGKGKDGEQDAKKEAAKPPAADKQQPLGPPPAPAEAKQETAEGDAPQPLRKRETLVPVWVVRFTPQETGRHTLQMYVRNGAGETRLPERSLVVVPETKAVSLPGCQGGNVVVSKRDPRQLELQDGSPFFIFGQNVCWTTDWKPYLEQIRAYGGNACRIWLCPWGLNLERKQEPGTYDLKEAARLDDLIVQAEATGVRLIFCFTFHGMNTDEWSSSPYNQANGGPCVRPQEFFTEWKAKRQFKRLLSYAAARWGSSPAILSWELMNEMDIARYENREDVSAWAREMAGHLKHADVHNHLVTTSVIWTGFEPEMWLDSRLDFVSIHGYGKDVQNVVYQRLAPYQMLNKPVLLAEFGGGTDARDDIPDKDGARLQAALWLTACSPGCGAALPWWWDTYIEARGLYPVLAAAGRFLAGEDRRGRFGEWVKKTYPEAGVEVTGVLDSSGARLYVHNPAWTRLPESRGAALTGAPLPLELTGMMDGAYKVEFWDAREGKVFATVDATAQDGKLTIQIPARQNEIGVKVDRTKRAKPELK
jgi:hypothetical protein